MGAVALARRGLAPTAQSGAAAWARAFWGLEAAGHEHAGLVSAGVVAPLPHGTEGHSCARRWLKPPSLLP